MKVHVGAAQLGQMKEIRQKCWFPLKKLKSWLLHLILTVIWQIFDMKSMQLPETEVWPICLKKKKFDKFIFGGFNSLENHSEHDSN